VYICTLLYLHCQFKVARRYGPQIYFGARPPALPKCSTTKLRGPLMVSLTTGATCRVFMTRLLTAAAATTTTTTADAATLLLPVLLLLLLPLIIIIIIILLD